MSCPCDLNRQEVELRNRNGTCLLVGGVCQNGRIDGVEGLCGYPLHLHPSLAPTVGESSAAPAGLEQLMQLMVGGFAQMRQEIRDVHQAVQRDIKQDIQVVKRKVKKDVESMFAQFEASMRQEAANSSSALPTTHTLSERYNFLARTNAYVNSVELKKFLEQIRVNWWPVNAPTSCPGEVSRETATCQLFFTAIMELLASGTALVKDYHTKATSKQKSRTVVIRSVPNLQAHKEHTIGNRSPDAVFYDGCEKKGNSYITMVGDVKGGSTRGEFKHKDIGQLTDYLERLLVLQPFRTTLYGFLTDCRRFLFVRCTRKDSVFRFEHVTSFQGRAGWQVLFGLMESQPEGLGFVNVEIPGYAVEGLLGTGAFSTVLHASREVAIDTDAAVGGTAVPGLPQGFSRRRVAGDGNYFFHAMVDQLRRAGLHAPDGTEYTHERLRDRALQFVIERPELRTLMSGEEQIDLAKLTGWVDHIAVVALAQALGVNIHIIQPPGRPPFLAPAVHTAEGEPTPDVPNLHVFYNGINHYDSLVPAEAVPPEPAVPEQGRNNLRKRQLSPDTTPRKKAKIVRQDIAVKIFLREEYQTMLENEVHVLTELRGMRNVPTVIGERRVNNRPALIITPVAEKVHPLHHGVRTCNNDYVQLLQVLSRAHFLGFCHRDVKPANIFKANGIVILNDWSSSAATGKETTWAGTEKFYDKPPEGATTHEPNPAHDLVALVRSVYMMWTGLSLRDPNFSNELMWREALEAAMLLDYEFLLIFFHRL